MSDPISLSKVDFSEIELLQKVCAHVYAINFGSHWEKGGLEKYLQAQFGSEQVQKDLENPDKLYYFIKYESQIIGFIKVCLHVGIRNYQAITTAELEKIYVLPEFEGRVDVHQRKGRLGRIERLAGKVQHDRGILTDRIEHDRILKFGSHFADDVNALCLQLSEVGHRVLIRFHVQFCYLAVIKFLAR